jgi:hypothetical protein
MSMHFSQRDFAMEYIEKFYNLSCSRLIPLNFENNGPLHEIKIGIDTLPVCKMDVFVICTRKDYYSFNLMRIFPSIDASYQVSLHLAEGFQRRRLKCEKLTDDIRRMPSDGKSSH